MPQRQAKAGKPDLTKDLPSRKDSKNVPNYSHPRKASSASCSAPQVSPGTQIVHIGLGVDSLDYRGEASCILPSVPLRSSTDSNYQLQPLTFESSHPKTKRHGGFDFNDANVKTPQEHRPVPSARRSPVLKRCEGPDREQRVSVESTYSDVLGWTDAVQSSPESEYPEETRSQHGEALTAALSLRCQMPGHANLSKHWRSSSREHHWGDLEYDEERERNFCNACYESMPNFKDTKWRSVATYPVVDELQGPDDLPKSPKIAERVVEHPKRPSLDLNSRFNKYFKLDQDPRTSSTLASRRRGLISGTPYADSSRIPSSAWSKPLRGHIAECSPEPKGTRQKTPGSSIKLKPMTRDRSHDISVSSVGELWGVPGWNPSNKKHIASGFHELIDDIDRFYAELVTLYDYLREDHMIYRLVELGIRQEEDGSY